MHRRSVWLIATVVICAASSCSFATTIGEAKAAGPGWSGYLQGFVTAVFPDYGCMVIEEANRSAAIVVHPWAGYNIGTEVSVQGSIQADGDFLQSSVSPTGFVQSVFPVALSNKALTGMVGNPGVSNSELLVTTWGKVLDYRTTYPDGSIRFHISDGAAQAGGPTVTLPVGVIQQVSADAVQVTVPQSATDYAYPVIPGQFVTVAGIAGKGQTSSGNLRGVMIPESSNLRRIPVGGEMIEKGAYPPIVAAGDYTGDYGPGTPGTTTHGLQEAIDCCVSHGRDLYIKGPGGFNLYSTLRIPAAKRFTIEGGNYDIVWQGSDTAPDDTVVIDSAKDCHYRLGLIVGPGSGAGAILKVKPQNPIPNDGSTGFVDSDLRLECCTNKTPFDPGYRTGTGIYFDTTSGPIMYNDIFVIAVMNLQTQVLCPDEGFAFAYNNFEIGHLHTNAVNSTLLHLGAMSSQNHFRIAMGVDQQKPDTTPVSGVTGIDIFGANNTLDISSRNGWLEPNKEIIFEPSATGNQVRYLVPGNPLGWVTDLATNPTNRLTWGGAPAPVVLLSATTGTFSYTQRLFPTVVRLTGGDVSSVILRRAGDSIDFGAGTPRNILMGPGDRLDITSSTAPSVYVIPT